eukprot:UN00345
MPREIIHPVPFHSKGLFVGEWAHVRSGFWNKRTAFVAGATFYTFLFSLAAYADRRCLSVYQRHDPRAVELPWEQEFRSKYMSHH